MLSRLVTIATVTKLLDDESGLIEARDDQGRTLLHLAVLANRARDCRYACGQGPRPQCRR